MAGLFSIFTPRLPAKTAATLCNSLATLLDAGVPLLKAFDTVSKKTGDARCREHLGEIRTQIKQGTEISEALRSRGGYFPPLLVDMVTIGENTGALPEILRGLAGHYENLIKLRRAFLGAIFMPVLQLFAAILIIAGLILVLGLITPANGKPIDILGLGLLGPSGALTFLAICFGTIFGLVGGYFLLSETFQQKRMVDSLLMKIPVVGKCLRSFAIARFSWALGLTQQTGMSLMKSLDFSLRASGNGAFQQAAGPMIQQIQEGDELTLALAQSGLFPDEYLQMLEVAEASGTIPETLHRLSPQFEAEARRALATLSAAFAMLIWGLVAGVIILVIFKIALWYLGMINSALNDAMG
jgi:type IV pilus assembly protein PilC